MKNKSKKQIGLIKEIFFYLKTGKKYWLIPIILLLILFSILIIISETMPIISPFIYTLF